MQVQVKVSVAVASNFSQGGSYKIFCWTTPTFMTTLTFGADCNAMQVDDSSQRVEVSLQICKCKLVV